MKHVKELSKQDWIHIEASTSVSAGFSCKRVLSQVEKALDNKKALKDEKEKVLSMNDDKSKQRTLWILKIMKLFYFTLTSLDFTKEDAYLYFVLSPIFKNLLCNDPRTCLLFGKTNLKAKAIEVNRYLGDEKRRFAGPKIDIVVKDENYNMEIMLVEVSGPPNKNILEEDNGDPSPHVFPRKKRKYTSSKAKDEAGSQEEE
ncbi:hypothetical protein G6F43_006151 [Rhizopus delemar]|nr:hypothetical protein G6F43_006151 [Rhizopus delemar]